MEKWVIRRKRVREEHRKKKRKSKGWKKQGKWNERKQRHMEMEDGIRG